MKTLLRKTQKCLQAAFFAGFGLSLGACTENIESASAVAFKSTGEFCSSETFQVPASIANPVDILFVVQTSSSLSEVRQKILSSINDFISGFPAQSDFNIAVMLSHGSTSNYSGKLYRAESEPLVLKSSQWTSAQLQSHLETKLTLAPADVDSGGGEEGMFSLFRGITTSDLLAESQAAEFFRTNAALSVVFIADRRDICAQSPPEVPDERDPVKVAARVRDCEGLTATGLINRLNLLKGTQPLLVSGIIYAKDPTPAGTEIGYGYTDMIALGGGSAIDIAKDDIRAGLVPIIALGGQLTQQNVFTLSEAGVDPETLTVKINDLVVPFTFESGKVTVLGPVLAGATVVISYCLNGDNPYVGLCKVFESATQWESWTPSPSTQDLQLKNRSGNISVEAVRNLLIENVSGKVNVDSAMAVSSISSLRGSAYIRLTGDIGAIKDVNSLRIDKAGAVGSITDTKGGFQLNALSVGSFSNDAGNACIRAKSIGKIESMKGTKTFIAAEIDELSGVSGNVHIYGAVVRSVKNASGKICLYNGAKVLSASQTSGFIGRCN